MSAAGRLVRSSSVAIVAGAIGILGSASMVACDASPRASASAAASATGASSAEAKASAVRPLDHGGALDMDAMAAKAASATATATEEPTHASGVDIHSVMRRARYAFRESTETANGAAHGFAARGESYRVVVDGRGSVALSTGASTSAAASFVFAAAEPATGAPHREADGALTVPRGEMTERLENRPEGLEASWSFAQRPRVPHGRDRDLHLRISTSGLSYNSTSVDGVHFGRDDDPRGVRIGRATWVDALGRRTSVAAHFERDSASLVFDVPATVLDQSTYPAALDPLVGPENGGDAPVTLSSTQAQTTVSVCASSSMYYVTWLDQRRAPEDPYSDTPNDLYGARVDPATGRAVPADADGVLLAPDLTRSVFPTCASDGTNFLVAVVANYEVVGVRVDGASGQPIAEDRPAGIVLGSEISSGALPSIGYANGNYLVAWAEVDRLASARLPSTGAPLATGEIIRTGIFGNPYVACSTTGCLVLYLDTSDYESYFAHDDPATGPLAADATTPIELPYGNTFVTGMVWTGSAYLITWVDITGVSNLGISVSSQLDAVLWSSITNAPVGNGRVIGSGFPSNATLAFDGTRGVVGISIGTPTTGYEVYLNATTLAGSSAAGISGLTSGTKVGLAGIAGSSLFAGISPTADGSIVTARIDDSTGATNASDTGGTPLSLAANAETEPSIAANANGALAAWTDDRVGGNQIYAARLDKNGNVLPADIAGVALRTVGAQASAPSVATDGTDFVVAWFQVNAGGSEISGGRVSAATGALTQTLPPISDALESAVGNPAIVYGDGKYAIGYAGGNEAVVNLVDATSLAVVTGPLSFGTPPDSAFPNPFARGAALAYSGTNFLFAWNLVSDVSGTEVAGARFLSNGAFRDGDGSGVVLTELSDSASGIAVAGSIAENSYILTWFDRRDPANGVQVYSRVVAAEADFSATKDAVVGGSGIVFDLAVEDPPATAVTDAADGLSFQVAWSTTSAMYGALVGYDGVVRDSTPLLIADDPGYYAHPALATVSPGSMILAYTRDILSPPYGDYRVRTRLLSTGPLAGTCQTADDCASRNCTDGYCCDAPCHGSCQTCAATPGKCTMVENKVDPDSCSGDHVCDAAGVCGLTLGNACDTDSACASGFCADDVCCESACDGSCDVCNAGAGTRGSTAGTCTIVAAGNEGVPSCAPDLCNGTSASCPTSCAVDSDCTRPYACDIHNVCSLLTSGECTDAVTLKSPNGNLTKCTPYRCQTDACATACKSIADCADGSICAADGTCVAPTADDLGSGCAVAPSHAKNAKNANEASDALVCLGIAASAIAFARRRRGPRLRLADVRAPRMSK